jgi:hypothetical protein
VVARFWLAVTHDSPSGDLCGICTGRADRAEALKTAWSHQKGLASIQRLLSL